APAGGGVEVGTNAGTIELISCTVIGNHSTGTSGAFQGGGGIGLFGTGGSHGTIVLRNSIVAGNTTATTGPDAYGAGNSLHYNFIGGGGGSSGWLNQDHLGTSENPLDPQLGPLQDNGGPTRTHAPLAGSPVLFAGDPYLSGPDQRGSFRQTGT